MCILEMCILRMTIRVSLALARASGNPVESGYFWPSNSPKTRTYVSSTLPVIYRRASEPVRNGWEP